MAGANEWLRARGSDSSGIPGLQSSGADSSSDQAYHIPAAVCSCCTSYGTTAFYGKEQAAAGM